MIRFASLLVIATSVALAAMSVEAVAGDLAFTPGGLPTSFGPIDVAAADLDGDGHTDLAIVEPFSSQVVVRLGDGAGGFGAGLAHPVGFQPQALLLAHLDGDQTLDLITADAGASAISVSLGLGDGHFGVAVSVPVGTQPRSLAVADIDADGDLDVVVGHDSLATPVCILLGDGLGGLSLTTVLPPGFAVTAVALADVAGDALPELLISDRTNARLSVWQRTASADGGFEPLADYPLSDEPGGLDVADLDSDGHLDVVVALSGGDGIARLMGQPAGGLGNTEFFIVGNLPSKVRLVDIDGDEHLDAVLVSSLTNLFTWLSGDGDGSFGPPSSFFTGSFPTGLAAADLDGDFFTDVIVANSFDNTLSIFTATAGPWVSLGGNVAGAWGPTSLEPTGSPTPREAVSLTAHGAPAGSPGLLFLGLNRLDAPFFGGTLVPAVLLAIPLRAELPLEFIWPDLAPPGLVVYLQGWVQVGPTVVGTDALRAVTQSP